MIKLKMKQTKPILLTVILLIVHQISFGQQLSKQVTDFIEVQDSIVVIKNVTIIDGTGAAVKYNQDILVQKKRITALGNTGELKIPENVRIIDATGKTVIPGLIMMHEHLFHAKPFFGMFKAVHMTNTFPQLYLAGGVTTMRTAGSIEANTDLNIRNLIAQGKRLGPSMNV
ncbi:MAG: amidohydrolase, partial [Ignavibacteria bacterium]|nr:amidohydrolase [Ignavibacteria bacterium]